MFTGKYTLDAPPGGPRKAVFQALKATPDYDNLLATMKMLLDTATLVSRRWL
jgi:hypothetical protein